MGRPNLVHIPVLAAELPPGWSTTESATLIPPSGRTIEASVSTVPAGCGAQDLIDREVEVARSIIGTVDVGASDVVNLRGRALARSCDLRFEHDGDAYVVRVACGVIGDHALRFIGRWPADDLTAPAEFDTAIASAFVWTRVIDVDADGAPFPDTPSEPTPATRSPLSPDTWSTLRTVWSSGPSAGVAAALHDVSRWSAYELLVAAAMAGSESFPTLDSAALARAPQATVDAVTEAVLASLTARGLAHDSAGDGDGRRGHVAAGPLASLTEMALAPDLVLWIQRRDDAGSGGWWIGVRPDAALQITLLPDGGRESAWLEPEEVVDHVLSLVSGSPSQATITALWHDAAVINGGTFAWEVDEQGVTVLGDEQVWDSGDSPSWQFEPAAAEALRGHLLAYLPGGFSESEAT